MKLTEMKYNTYRTDAAKCVKTDKLGVLVTKKMFALTVLKSYVKINAYVMKEKGLRLYCL